MEAFKIAKLFTCADKFNRLARYSPYRKCSTASCVTIKLCKNNTVNSKCFIKAFCNINGILTCHCINYKKDFIRMNRCTDILKLLHKLFINMKSTGCIKEHIIMTMVLGVFNSLFRYFNRIFSTHFKYRNANLLTDNLQLLNSSRTINIAGNKHGSMPFIFQF